MSTNDRTVKVINEQGPMGFVLFVAYFGAVAYFMQSNPGFGGFLLSLLKAIIWPGYVMYAVLGLLGVK